MFPTEYTSILSRIEAIDPVHYGKTRNYIDGAVTRLSPYLSRGVISTRQVMESVLNKGYSWYKIEKFIQELAWRDYWQQVWKAKGDAINFDLKSEQAGVTNHKIPASILNGTTGISAIDHSIKEFYETGYLHNHVRMYVASMACNVGGSHWKAPAQWMYYHLLDGDWASNALSWQWVAGTNAGKKYVANQANINKYCYTNQRNTFLDVEYAALKDMPCPRELSETVSFHFETTLPSKSSITIDADLPTFIYNYYNLDPLWKGELPGNKILLLEPSHFRKYPVSSKALDFALKLSTNIPNIQLYVGEFDELMKDYQIQSICYKEHPLSTNYYGIVEQRDWMFEVNGYYPSFFGFWKKCLKELKTRL